MDKFKTKTGLFGAALALATVLLASFPAQGQYESFFGGETWKYATAYHPITKSTADYYPYLIACLTNTYSFNRSDTVVVGGQKYYKGTFDGMDGYQVKLREDTLNGRLYALIEDREFLLCDMSLSIGDTFRLPVSPRYNYNYVDTMRMLVDSVTFVNSKKVLHLSAVSEQDAFWWFPFLAMEGAYNISLRFMEGVGPMYGIVPPYQEGDVLLCLTKDDTLYYMTHPDLGCWQDLNAVSDYPEALLSVHPNPTADLLYIELAGAEIAHVALYDLQGRIIYSPNSPTNSPINMRNVPTGVYVLRVTGADGREYHRKIVKK